MSGDAERAVREVGLAINGLKNEPTAANHADLWRKFDRAIEAVKAQCQAFVLERMEHWKRDENEACAQAGMQAASNFGRNAALTVRNAIRSRIGKEGE